MPIKMPRVNINIIPSYQALQSNHEQKILIVGQMTSAGSATAGHLYSSIANDGSQDSLFGAKSMLAGMIREFQKINNISRVDAIPLADAGSSTAAAGSIVFTGTATAAGSLVITVGSSINHQYTIAVAKDETADQIGAAVVAAFAADTRLPVGGVNTTGSVAITASNTGTEGNAIQLSVTGTVAGVTYAVTQLTTGAGDPVMTGIYTVVGNNRYQTVVIPYYGVAATASFLDGRWNVNNSILDGVAVVTNQDTLANIETHAAALNTKSIVMLPNKLTSNVSSIFELPAIISAQWAAIRSLRLTAGANISQYVVAPNGSLDMVGGAALASKPYFNTPMYNLPLVAQSNELSEADTTALLTSGCAVIGNNPSYTTVIMGQQVTTYKTDAASNPDVTFKYLNYVDTASQVREFFYNNLRAKYSQTRLTEGDVVPNRSMVNAGVIASELDGLYTILSGDQYALTQGGSDALTYFKANRSISVDMANGSVSVVMIVPIVTQLQEINIQMQIGFSING